MTPLIGINYPIMPKQDKEAGALQKIEVYDTTLRDGSQGEQVSFSLEDKLKLTRKLDEFGFDFIEGGWPGSNAKDEEFFREVRKLDLARARVAAFGSTRRNGVAPAQDENLNKLLSAETEIITLFGKSWDLHVRNVLRISLEENLDLISDSIDFLRRRGRRVFFDAEHFFDGYRENPAYALKCLAAADQGGAERLVLADTNGGSLPDQVRAAMAEVKKITRRPLGIHTHNDGGLAVANSITAVAEGAVQVQGTLNGLGERCGNADLLVIVPILQVKMNRPCLDPEKLARLTTLAHYTYEVANLTPPNNQPFVGASAFAHKGGIHVDAIRKEPRSYEHLDPALVGNERRILVSELSGGATILFKAERYGINKKGPETRRILAELARLEKAGYQFEAAEGSFQLLVAEVLGKRPVFFQVQEFRVIVERKNGLIVSEASVKVKVGDRLEHTVAEGDGPVNALDASLRKALLSFYPSLADLRLTDYKVRVLNPEAATAAKVRVLIESADREETWGTVGLSENIIEASLQALADSIDYKLFKESAVSRHRP